MVELVLMIKFYATEQEKKPNKWLNNVGKIELIEINKNDKIKEFIMMSMRLSCGLNEDKFNKKFQINLYDFINIENLKYLSKKKIL